MKKGSIEEQIKQWEPQIYSLMRTYPVYGMTPEDVEQELKIVVLKCLKGYDPKQAAKFHSYLYISLKRRIYTLRAKESKQFRIAEKVGMESEDSWKNTEYVIDLLNDINFSELERQVVLSIVEGFTPRDLKNELNLTTRQFNRVKEVIKEKMGKGGRAPQGFVVNGAY